MVAAVAYAVPGSIFGFRCPGFGARGSVFGAAACGRSDRNGRSTKAAGGSRCRSGRRHGSVGAIVPQQVHRRLDPRIERVDERGHRQLVGKEVIGQMLAAAFTVAAADQQQFEVEMEVTAAGCGEKGTSDLGNCRRTGTGVSVMRTGRLRAGMPCRAGAGQRRPRRSCRRRKVDEQKEESDVSTQLHHGRVRFRRACKADAVRAAFPTGKDTKFI